MEEQVDQQEANVQPTWVQTFLATCFPSDLWLLFFALFLLQGAFLADGILLMLSGQPVSAFSIRLFQLVQFLLFWLLFTIWFLRTKKPAIITYLRTGITLVVTGTIFYLLAMNLFVALYGNIGIITALQSIQNSSSFGFIAGATLCIITLMLTLWFLILYLTCIKKNEITVTHGMDQAYLCTLKAFFVRFPVTLLMGIFITLGLYFYARLSYLFADISVTWFNADLLNQGMGYLLPRYF